MIFGEKGNVKIHGCFIVWDGITRPDTETGKAKYSLKVVVPPNSPDLQDMHNLAQKVLQSSPFKGVLPHGAGIPCVQTALATEYNGLYTGFYVFNCNTTRLPDVYDENGGRLDPMQYGQSLYGGQQVDVLVHCYHYDKAGNKGIATGLDGFSIIASANAPRQDFGGGGIDTSSAFAGGGGQQAAPAQQQGGFQQPAQQQGGFQQPAQQQGGFQQPAQQQGEFQQPAQQQGEFQQPAAPANNGQAYVDPNAQPAQQQGGFQQNNNAPQQSTNFLAPQQ